MRRRTAFRIVSTLAGFAALWTTPCRAVVDVRFERWQILASAVPRDVVAPLDSFVSILVEFDARATAGDAASGLRFAVAERDAGDNDVLVRFELGQCVELPAAGADVAVRATIQVYCDAAGELRALDAVRWLANWCDLPEARACASDGFEFAGVVVERSEPESWEFVVLDENDTEGSFPTPDDIIECGPLGTFVREYVAPGFPASGSIGIFADSTATACSARLMPFEPFHWYVVAQLDGLSRCGITLCEIGIRGVPASLFIGVTPNPHGVALDNPFTRGGVIFPCERGTGNRIVLYTLTGITTEPLADVALVLDAGAPPSNFLWPYPWVDLCPERRGLRRRVRGGTFYVNPSVKPDCEPPTRVTAATWSAVKRLYRD
jgi:hypothetical protein